MRYFTRLLPCFSLYNAAYFAHNTQSRTEKRNDKEERGLNIKRERLWRAVPFAMAMLLTTLLPLAAAAAAERGEPGAPVAQNMEIRAYRGVPYTGTLQAADNEGEAVTFALETLPSKGTLEFGAEGVFVYTPDANKAGADRFTFTATDESGHTSAPATVKIRIERVASGVSYSDTDGKDCATAAVDLAEHGVFVGARVGNDLFFEPERTVTRGEFVAMAMAAAGLKSSDVTVTGFCDDADIPVWAKGCAAGALSAGIIGGAPTEAGMAFRAGDDVTYSEAAAVLNRVLRVTDVSPADYGAAEPVWYAQAVANLESVSIAPAGGFSQELLERSVTRAEAAKLLSAAMALSEQRSARESFWSRIF